MQKHNPNYSKWSNSSGVLNIIATIGAKELLALALLDSSNTPRCV